MIAFLPLFSTFATVLIALLQVSANPAPDNLLARQAAPIDTSRIPAQCKSKCETLTTSLTNCASQLDCLCKDSNVDALSTCFGCVSGIKNGPLNATAAQGVLDQFADGCNLSGLPVKNATLKGESADKNNDAMSVVVGSTTTLGVLALTAILALA